MRSKIRNKTRREAFEVLVHLRDTNRLQRMQQASWQFLDWVLDKDTSGWSLGMLALFLGPLTDDTNPLLLHTLPKHVASTITPHECRQIQKAKSTTTFQSPHKERPKQFPVLPWGPYCGSEGPLLALCWDDAETLLSYPEASVSPTALAGAPAIHPPRDKNGDTDMDWEEDKEAKDLTSLIQLADPTSIIDRFDYYEDILNPDYRFVSQIHELLLELATTIIGDSLIEADTMTYVKEMGHRTEALFQVLRARAFHLCEPPSTLFGRKGISCKKIALTSKHEEEGKEKKDTTCNICLEESDPKQPAPTIDCGHHYCGLCLLRWVLRSANCPLCRKPVAAQALLPHVVGLEIDECLVEALPKEVLGYAFTGEYARSSDWEEE